MDMVSCMDCSHEFWNDDYQQHIKCISEEEKYSGKDYKPRPGQNKGELKQDAWLQQVQKAIDSSSSTPKVRHLLERLKDYPNIPRKQAKFLNFIKNSMRISDTKLANSVWDILMPVTQPKDKVNEKENDKNETNSEKDKCEKNKTEEEEEEEEEDSTKKVKKMSKREKKEERRKEQSKDEKKDKKQNHASEKVDNDEKNEEIGGRLPAKKKGKKRKRNDSSSAEDEDKNNVVLGEKNGEKTKPKKKSDKKRRHAEKDDDDDDLPPLEANPNHACFEETQDDDEEKDSPPKKKKSKNFNWEQIILSLLQKAKEKTMSEKKLRKKVLAEYVSQGGHVDSMSILKAKFDRKIKKNRQFVRQKDTVRLIDE